MDIWHTKPHNKPTTPSMIIVNMVLIVNLFFGSKQFQFNTKQNMNKNNRTNDGDGAK